MPPHEGTGFVGGLPMVELTWNWDEKGYEGGAQFWPSGISG
ncbi:MAG: hypothetical protein Q9M45_13775 [Robiginitomaculum sp.]|nr:hypothetical protein [Robiginitomaculum sp.]